ncbi:MAG: cytochrome c-type biogenesis protein CcmH [Betaproteobacteria bacterium]|nr:MAG: cytochrome c-type biogenesis protein CcmH [Betaproteobacteria bacterium]
MAKALFLALLLLLSGSALGKEAAPAVADPQLEARAMAIAGQLRCPVCQNQTIAESDADLAKDVRNLIREQLRQGKTEEDIVGYMKARYGDFILWRPPFKSTTLLLWLGPLLLLAVALIGLFYRLARERKAGEVELSEADHARAALLLESRTEAEGR